jgi:hypothetical protein
LAARASGFGGKLCHQYYGFIILFKIENYWFELAIPLERLRTWINSMSYW